MLKEQMIHMDLATREQPEWPKRTRHAGQEGVATNGLVTTPGGVGDDTVSEFQTSAFRTKLKKASSPPLLAILGEATGSRCRPIKYQR